MAGRNEVDTKVQCVVCKSANVIVVLESVTHTPFDQIPLGPGSRDYYHLEATSIHCPSCGVKYHHPPGQPNAVQEILASHDRPSDSLEIDLRAALKRK